MTTSLDLASNFNGSSITEDQQKAWIVAMRASLAEMGDPMAMYGAIQNLSVACSVGSSALTIALKTRAGGTPDADNPVSFPFRNVTIATGDFTVRNLTAASSLVISSGSTMGAVSGKPFRLWLVEFDDGGTLRPGAVNCLTTVAGAGSGRDVTAIYALKDDVVASAVSEGGAGAADSAGVIYAGATVTSKALRVIGYLEWASGLTTAGTWDAVPTKIQLFGAGVPLPGQVVQTVRTDTGAVNTGSTTVPADDTIPAITEGNEYMTQAITPTSKANALRVSAQAILSNAGGSGQTMSASLYQDAVTNALKTVAHTLAANAYFIALCPVHTMLAEIAASTTFRLRAGQQGAGTTTFNGSGGSRFYGGVMNSFLQVEEIMG